MQFPTLSTLADWQDIVDGLQVGDIVKVREKGYSDSFSTHFVMVEAKGSLAGVGYVEITDLHVGQYTPTLRRRTVSTRDEFWAGIDSCEVDEALDSFNTAYTSSGKRATQAQASWEEAAAEFAVYRSVHDRLGAWL